MSIEKHKPFLEGLAKGISSLFGANCEVTVHDLTHGHENTIIAIENGHVTGRHIGDDASEVVLQAIKKDATKKVENHYAYFARTKDGRIVKSSSIFLRDDNGELVSMLGINYDVTDLIMAKHAIEATVSIEKTEEEESIGTISTNVNDLLDQLIEEADAFVGIPVAKMTKDEKTRAIQFLNEKGAFLIKKAGDKVSKHYDISKYTLYNYMDADTN